MLVLVVIAFTIRAATNYNRLSCDDGSDSTRLESTDSSPVHNKHPYTHFRCSHVIYVLLVLKRSWAHHITWTCVKRYSFAWMLFKHSTVIAEKHGSGSNTSAWLLPLLPPTTPPEAANVNQQIIAHHKLHLIDSLNLTSIGRRFPWWWWWWCWMLVSDLHRMHGRAHVYSIAPITFSRRVVFL